MSLNIAAGLGWEATNPILESFSRLADLPMGYRSKTATSSCRRFPVLVRGEG